MQTQIRLPEGWGVRKLGDMAKIIMGQSPPSKTYNSEGKGLPFFQGKAEFGDMHPTPKKWCSEPKKVANKNDILISVRAPVGPVNLSDSKCCIGRGLCAIRTKLDKLNYNYLYNFLKSQEDILSKRGQGSTFTAISKKDVFEIKIPIPFPNDPQKSLEKQQKIVARLDAFFEHYNKLKKEKQKAKEKYERIIQSAIASLIPQKELPDGWEEKKLKEITTKTERKDSKKELNKQFFYIDISSINKEKFLIENPKYILGKDAPSRARRLIKQNDVIFSTNRPNLRTLSIIPKEYDNQICSTGFCVLRSSDRILPRFLFYLMISDYVLDQINPKMRGIQYPAVSDSDVFDTTISLPPLEEQKRIIEKLDVIYQGKNNVDKHQKNIDYQLEQLPKAVLSKAFKGELV